MTERIRNASITVGTTVVRIAEELQPGQRQALSLVNTSTAGQVISLSWGQEAGALIGVVLYPGGSWSESVDSAFMPSERLVTAVSSAAGGTLAVQERIKVL
jgi:hypothetical protein